MRTELIFTLLGILLSLVGVLISYLALNRNKKKDIEKQAQTHGVLASDIGYIKAGIDDLKYENRAVKEQLSTQEKHLAKNDEQIARCEESTKSAHKRIDEIHDELIGMKERNTK